MSVRKFAIAAAIAALFAAVMLLGATAQNEGCLPWQERVGISDGVFGEQEDITRCSGSRLPFGSTVLSRSGDLLVVARVSQVGTAAAGRRVVDDLSRLERG